jgi:hypothetical protein
VVASHALSPHTFKAPPSYTPSPFASRPPSPERYQRRHLDGVRDQPPWAADRVDQRAGHGTEGTSNHPLSSPLAAHERQRFPHEMTALPTRPTDSHPRSPHPRTPLHHHTTPHHQQYTKARSLDLSINRIEQIDNLKFCAQLRQLRLDRNRLSTVDNLQANHRLERLFLGGNVIKDSTPKVGG